MALWREKVKQMQSTSLKIKLNKLWKYKKKYNCASLITPRHLTDYKLMRNHTSNTIEERWKRFMSDERQAPGTNRLIGKSAHKKQIKNVVSDFFSLYIEKYAKPRTARN